MQATALVVEVIREKRDKHQLCRGLSRQHVVEERKYHKHCHKQSAAEYQRRRLVVSQLFCQPLPYVGRGSSLSTVVGRGNCLFPIEVRVGGER